MTLETTIAVSSAAPLDVAALQNPGATPESIENRAAQQSVSDNPNPGAGDAPRFEDGPSREAAPEEAANPNITAREKIAAAARQKRQSADADDGLTQNEMGEYVPPFVRRQEEQAAAQAAEAEQARQETQARQDEPKTYTLKVRGQEIPLSSRDELLKWAEVEQNEADLYTDAALIKLAQKQYAASSDMENAKAAVKSARTAARDTGDTHPEQTADDTQDHDDGDTGEARHQSIEDRKRALAETIQYGEPDEVAAAHAELTRIEIREERQSTEFDTRMATAARRIKTATEQFEAANQDLIADPTDAEITYKVVAVSKIRNALQKVGADTAFFDQTVGNDIGAAVQVYATVAAYGKVNLPPPEDILADVAQTARQRLNRPRAQPANDNVQHARSVNDNRPQATAPARQVPPSRIALKRALLPQPARATAPTAAAPKSGQEPAARSQIVANMRKARGR